MEALLSEIRKCDLCASFLPEGPRPIVSGSASSKLLIIGHAPGSKVHKSGIPWDDPSGDQLRRWLEVEKETFYDPSKVALVPMGFCYPGKGKSGDLPPRPECAPTWHVTLLNEMKSVELILLVGQYAQKYYLENRNKRTLTQTVQAYQDFLPKFFPLPHPSPRNRIWLKKNEWFEKEILPVLKSSVKKLF